MNYLKIFISVLVALGAMASSANSHLPAIHRKDGTLIHWYLDRQMSMSKQGIIVLAQGSGCESVIHNKNIEIAKGLLPGFAALTVDKYGVNPGDSSSSMDDCSKVYFAHHTVSQRVEDYVTVLKQLEHMPWWNGQLVLFGGSEGGAVVEILAARVNANAAVVFSSATGIPFRDAFVQVLPPDLATRAADELRSAKRHPMSAHVWAGNSYRWWADIIDRPLWKEALRAKEPILVVQGRRDRSNPVVAARAFRDAFDAEKRCNLTYWEFEDYDHTMTDTSGVSHLRDVLTQIGVWLRQRLAGDASPGCTK